MNTQNLSLPVEFYDRENSTRAYRVAKANFVLIFEMETRRSSLCKYIAILYTLANIFSHRYHHHLPEKEVDVVYCGNQKR